MPIVPMKQTVIRKRKTGDEWDGTLTESNTPMKCRFSEGTKLVTSLNGDEVVSTAAIYFDKLADVKPTDTFEFTNEANVTRSYIPISIEIKRGLNGKPMLTVVSV